MLTKPGVSKLVSNLITVIYTPLEKLSDSARHTHKGNVVRSTSSAFRPRTRFALLSLIFGPPSMSDSKVKNKCTKEGVKKGHELNLGVC